ncbi:MAG: acyl-CoA dehydrogenase family protein [Acidimicrobiales bacterium]
MTAVDVPPVPEPPPERGAVPTAARQLGDAIRARATDIEAAGRLPGELVADLRATGVFGMWLPRELGGAEASPDDVVDAIEALAAADGSTGWCAAVGVGTNALGAYLPEDGARDIFSSPATVTGGSFNPSGQATVTATGLRVSGCWGFGSGVRHSDWMGGACVVMDTSGAPVILESGRPDARMAFFRTADATIVDTWHVSGLRGTGSDDFAVTDLDIPLRHTMAFAFQPWPGGFLWRMPPMALFFAPMAAVPLGIARSAIDELVRLAAEKTPYRSSRRLAERDVVQSMVARAEAAVRSAGAFLREALDEVHAEARRGNDVTMRQRALVRLAVVNSAQAGVLAVDLCAEAAGSTSLFTTSPLQRHLRDVQAVRQHVVLAFPGLETVGRVLLGLEPDTPLL